MIVKKVVLVLVLISLAACANRSGRDDLPAQVEDRVIVDGKVLPLPEDRNIQARAMSTEKPSSTVVRNLISKAQTQRDAGNWDGAADSLERALRIEPRNALLWSRLADIRYSQQSWQKAIQLAAKSNTLARDNENLRRQNWYLMANAYDEVGNAESAQKYRDKLSAQPQ